MNSRDPSAEFDYDDDFVDLYMTEHESSAAAAGDSQHATAAAAAAAAAAGLSL